MNDNDLALTRGRIVAFAMMTSVVILGVLPYLNLFPVPAQPPDPIIRISLIVVAAMELLAAPIVGRIILRVASKKPEQNPANAIFLRIIVMYAFWESSAIMGFMLYFICGDTTSASLFNCAALVGMMISWPRAT